MALSKKRRVNQFLFNKIFRSSRVFSSSFFTLRVGNTPREISKFSLIVPKKVEKKATKRNKIKRRVAAVLAGNLGKIKNERIVLVFIKEEVKYLKINRLENELLQVFEKAKLLK